MSTKIKILVISNYTNTLSARPEAAIFNNLAKEGVKVEIMTDINSEHAKTFAKNGIKLVNHTPSKKVSFETISLIKRTLNEGKHDIILLYNSKAIINGLIATMFKKTKVILYRGCAGNISSWDPFAYTKYLNPRVDKVICNAKSAETLLKSKTFFKEEKAITIRKGHDITWYDDVKKDELSKFDIPREAFVICCAANARPVKGIRYLIESMRYFDANYPVHLLIIGAGHEDKTNMNTISSLPNKNKIHIVGFQKESLSIVKASSVFVLPSIGQETLTKSVIEAMSLEIPCVISDVPGNSYLVENMKTGIIVPIKDPKAIADSIKFLYDHPSERLKMSKVGKAYIKENLSSVKTAKEYLQLFKEMVSPN